KEEDEKKAGTIKVKNNADAMVATAEKALKDAGDKVDAKIKEKVEEKVKALKEISGKEGATKEEIETATKDLSDTLSQIGQAMYGNQGQPQGDQPKGEEKKNENGEEKKKDKEEKVEEGEVVE
ncbi:MAG: Chaperone protein DnaK, partial [Candidatus Woesebacteria bacterium GW2011_GWB1_45_5]